MKVFICIGLCIACALLIFAGNSLSSQSFATEQEYIRIHIRANSNKIEDQNIKFVIKDKITTYLTPIVANCEDYEDVSKQIEIHLNSISELCTGLLEESGFSYEAEAHLRQEYFPTRTYENSLTLTAGIYDALIIELGTGSGDNWWCVIYPPLCFVNTTPSGVGVIYKSKILEMIQNFFKGG